MTVYSQGQKRTHFGPKNPDIGQKIRFFASDSILTHNLRDCKASREILHFTDKIDILCSRLTTKVSSNRTLTFVILEITHISILLKNLQFQMNPYIICMTVTIVRAVSQNTIKIFKNHHGLNS